MVTATIQGRTISMARLVTIAALSDGTRQAIFLVQGKEIFVNPNDVAMVVLNLDPATLAEINSVEPQDPA